VVNDSIPDKYLIVVGDTILNNSISLNEIYILPKLKFTTSNSRRRYLILQRKTIKVYPYAKLAAERLESLNERLGLLKSKRKQKKYARMVQKFVEDEFAATLKKFTITEGQILIKLIHRQTGETAFDLIKTLRSGWRAFWYNNTAKLFKMSLKIPFDPNLSEEDYLIEDILQRQFQNGRLEYQKSYQEFDLYALSKKWRIVR
jgi:hypothetical protein|tara:strand:- start:1012 stop:1617 length:606 start_codon:yes stop_codon:yes gene_type:complete